MTEQPPVDESEFAELGEVYGLLKRDAKDMLLDLLEGVSLWRSTARILFGVALLAFLLVPLFAWGAASTQPTNEVAFSLTVSTGLGLIGIFMFSLGVVTTFTGIRYRSKYQVLKSKYSELYETAKKLG